MDEAEVEEKMRQATEQAGRRRVKECHDMQALWISGFVDSRTRYLLGSDM